ncbi:unnamed protein product [Closterium sp. NIES-64]|nr:unnamed protein product [Closterium sp. NIES-64]
MALPLPAARHSAFRACSSAEGEGGRGKQKAELGEGQHAGGAAAPPSALAAARQAVCTHAGTNIPPPFLPLPLPSAPPFPPHPPHSMLVVQPRPHPRWLLRAKLGEALRLVDSLTGTDSQWEMEQRSWGGAGAGEDAQAAWRGGQEPQQGRGGAREWQGGGEQWRQGEAEGGGYTQVGWMWFGGHGLESLGFGFGSLAPGGGASVGGGAQQRAGYTRRYGSFFGSGTIESIAAHVHASHTMGVPVEAVFVNAALSGVQQRNLEAAWGLSVVDRVGLIIEILGARANSGPFTSILPLAALFLPPLSPPAPLKAAWGLPVVDRVGLIIEILGARANSWPFHSLTPPFFPLPSSSFAPSPSHLPSPKAAWGLPVVDRVGLIIEIFGARANTREAKLQNSGEAAQAEAADSASEEDTWPAPIGPQTSCWEGGGKGRGLPVVAVVGYNERRARARATAAGGGCGGMGCTNAGKSTLVTALSQSPQYIDDRLFATLDPRVRAVKLPSGRRVLLSDTVGFISDLPHQLVEAFHATLEEVVEADLLLHVVDASAPDMHQQRQAVLQVLTQMGVPVDPGMAADVSMAARGSSMGVHHGGYGGPPPSLAPPALRLVHSRVTSA